MSLTDLDEKAERGPGAESAAQETRAAGEAQTVGQAQATGQARAAGQAQTAGQREAESTAEVPTRPPEFDHCAECGAPVERLQRYCVVCGSHRRGIPDPAATYMAKATARTRPGTRTAGGARGAAAAARGRANGVAIALALAVIPVAVGVGVAVGRSSNGQDAQLIHELSQQSARQRAELASALGSSGSAGTATGSGSSNSASTHTRQAGGRVKHTGKRTAARSHGSTGSAVVSSKVTPAQKQQGEAEAQGIQKATGKQYVKKALGLPNSVVVP